METKLRAVFASGFEGVEVSELCRQLEISRQTFYKYKNRWDAEGPPGLVERSRRPHRSPGMISAALEDEIVRLRKDLELDRGAQTIAYHLGRSGWPVPSVATIHRVLVRRGLVIRQPQKRPRSAWRRFEWPYANDAWQIDATRWVLRSGREVWVMDMLDDHSRLVVAARACTGPTVDAAWTTFCDAASIWGLPVRVMSDNGSCFTGRFLNGAEVDFERNLRTLGIKHLLSSPAHPQTCGKIERFHQTLKRWLAMQPRARSIPQLQTQLDRFLDFYNHERPHRALHGATPSESWSTGPRTAPAEPIPEPPCAQLRRVSRTGTIGWQRYRIGIGTQHAGQHVLVIARDDDLTLFGRTGLLRRLRIDPRCEYQPTGRPPGRPPRHQPPNP